MEYLTYRILKQEGFIDGIEVPEWQASCASRMKQAPHSSFDLHRMRRKPVRVVPVDFGHTEITCYPGCLLLTDSIS